MEQGAEEGAFATFFRRNFASVAASPSLALGSPELGEDAAAEAFARAYARWSTVRAYDSPVGWTYRVGLNHGLRTAKRRGREAVLLGRGGHRAPAAEPPIDVDFWALLRELPDARVAVIVDDAEHWTTSLGSNEDRLVWISRGTLLSDLPLRCVVNERYVDGQQTSVACGLEALTEPVDAYVVCLSDLPLMRPADLHELFGAFAHDPQTAILMPVHQGQRGNPVVFDAGLRDALLATPGGARAWMDAHPGAVRRHPVAHPGFTTDLDTLDDVAALGRLADAPKVELP